tara:strand:+ start:9803 stop:11347 length:1545 start_codon:yes stop_codon:yes gene_type:complete
MSIKISKLPSAQSANPTDLLTIVQNGVTKKITKNDLLKSLRQDILGTKTDVSKLSKNISKTTLDKTDPVLSKPLTTRPPLKSNHAATKSYVDSHLEDVVKVDGRTLIVKPLKYHSSVENSFEEQDLVNKKFVDSEISKTLKTVVREKGSNGYPPASAGEIFLIEDNYEVFAIDGPEVQVGDIVICVENSDGGRHGAVGHQYAIVNTNVVFSTEDKAGILKVASNKDLELLDSNVSALTPSSYKKALEIGSEHNRIEVSTSSYSLLESDKGIIGVDSRRNSVTLTLPSIGRLSNPKLVKYLIKDEYGSALKNNITVVASGGDTIQGSRTFLINSNDSSVKLYTDSIGKWYIESNVTGGSDVSLGVKTFATDDLSNGERVTTTGAYESVMSIDVDLREYPVGTGFKVVSHCQTAGNGNTKTVAIGINGTQVLESSLTGTTAPNNQFIHHEATVLHSDTVKSMVFGFIMMTQDDTAAGLTNNLDLNWDQTITVSVDVNAATATTDVNVYALQIIPLK